MGQGDNVNPLFLFQGGIPFDGEVDIEWFEKIPNAQVAADRMLFMRTPRNIAELIRRGYDGEPIARMWKAVFRGCLAYDVPIPSTLHSLAREHGIILPEE